MTTAYSAWSKEWLPKDAKAKRRFRARLDYGVNSETDTTIQYWARVYVEINPTLSTNWTGYLRFDSDSTYSASGKTYYKKDKVVQLVSTKYKTYTKGTSATTGKISFSVKKASGSIAGTTMSSSVNVTIPAKRYDISFNANGGSNPPASQKKVHGTDLTLSTGVPTRAGYDFVSWNTAADGSGTSYASGATFSTNAITTLYAQWHLSYVPPKVENIRAYRVANGKSGYNPDVLSTGTKIYAEFKLTNPVSGTVTVSAKFGTTSQASSGTNGSIKYFYSSDGHLPTTSTETVTFTLSVTDYKNNKYTYTYSTFVSKEIYIFDAFKGTSGSTEYQSFALGGSARDFGSSSRSSKGNFDCYMDADFKGNVDVTGKINAKDADFNGTININGIPIKGCHKIRTIRNGETSSYSYDSIGWYMDGAKTVLLEETVSSQQNGLILVWSFYNGGAKNWGWNFTVIPKIFVPDNPDGGGMSTFMSEAATLGNVGVKYFYVRDDRIIGNDNNIKSGTGPSGIKYYNNRFVLRWVYGF